MNQGNLFSHPIARSVADKGSSYASFIYWFFNFSEPNAMATSKSFRTRSISDLETHPSAWRPWCLASAFPLPCTVILHTGASGTQIPPRASNHWNPAERPSGCLTNLPQLVERTAPDSSAWLGWMGWSSGSRIILSLPHWAFRLVKSLVFHWSSPYSVSIRISVGNHCLTVHLRLSSLQM